MPERPIRASEGDARDARMCLLFRCHAWVFAIPSDRTERLTPDATVSAARSPRDGVPVVEFGTRHFAKWDLGSLLGLAEVDAAWILLHLPLGDAQVPLALRIGAHLMVLKVTDVMPLDADLFRSRQGAVAGAFAIPPQLAAVSKPYGLLLDPTKLWTQGELEASMKSVNAIEGG